MAKFFPPTVRIAKIVHRKLSSSQRSHLESELKGVLDGMQETKRFTSFLFDLLTESEIVMLARRIVIAKHLLKGEGYLEISHKIRVGLHTIQQVDRWLRRSCEEYQKIFPPVVEQRERSRETQEDFSMPPSFRALRHKYPLHFLLFNLLLEDGDFWKGRSSKN